MFSLSSLLAVLIVIASVSAFIPHSSLPRVSRSKSTGVRGLTQVFDVLAGLSIAAQMNTATLNSGYLGGSSLPVAVVETRQGLYKEYTVERSDDSNVDKNVKTYKTAEETDDNKTKYWALLGVLLAGSFIIPMVQYYWYVADTDD